MESLDWTSLREVLQELLGSGHIRYGHFYGNFWAFFGERSSTLRELLDSFIGTFVYF